VRSLPLPAGNRLHAVLRRVEGSGVLDPTADRLAGAVSALTQRLKAKPALTGTWLGHAAHPVFTDFAEGAWMAGSFLDLFGPPASAPAAQRLVGFGLLAAVPTAVTGLGAWVDTDGGERRLGLLLAGTSTAVVALNGCSYLARRRNRQLAAAALGTLGGLLAIADGYIGGHLTLALGVGVGRTAFEELRISGHQRSQSTTSPRPARLGCSTGRQRSSWCAGGTASSPSPIDAPTGVLVFMVEA
jgi:hypothetical protein